MAGNANSLKKNEYFLIGLLSLIPVLIHLYTNAFAGYGYFRDELYYIACSNRLDLGYVDQPPFSIYILSVSRLLFGDSLFAIRLLPAVASGFIVFFSCLMARNLGGKKSAVIITAVAVIFSPIYLGMFAIYSMNSFDILLWSVSSYIVILILIESKLKYWITLGLIIGVGLLNKIGFLWFGFGFFMGLLLTNKRKELLTVKPYLCALIALLIFSIYIIWNFKNDFAHLEFIRNATSEKYSQLTAKDFILGQITNMNPLSFIIWLLGLGYFLFDKQGEKFRVLSIIYITSFLILLINGHSKAEYLTAAYPMLFAGGGVFIEKFTEVKLKRAKYILIFLIIISGILITPLALPILPVDSYIKYAGSLGMAPSSSEGKKLSELPQFYSDMFGWEELAQDVSKVYLALPEEERKRAIVFGRNYGEASSIEFFKKKYPLPDAISNHNSFWIWGYSKIENPVLIIIGGEKDEHLKVFESVDQAAIHTAKYSMPYENNIPVFIAKNIKTPISEVWKKIKQFE